MAAISKKDKLVEEAQKCVAKGQFDKAAKAYEQIIAIDPANVSLRQKLAEFLIKCNRYDDARKELEHIGKHFSKNGFYLKAIAVYKQLQKLFTDDITLSLTLAELNEKHGLTANALTEYKLVYEYHEKSGNKPESTAILEKMQNADQHNLQITLKLAETYLKSDREDDAYALCKKAVGLLLERGDTATLTKVAAKFQQLMPGRAGLLIDVVTGHLNKDNAATCSEIIQNILRNNPADRQAWELIISSYKLLGEPLKVKNACQHYLKFFPAELSAQLGLISALTVIRQLNVALELLEKYESGLISAGKLNELQQIYLELDKLDPINQKVTEGLIRVAKASGNNSEAESLASKLKSIQAVTGKSTASAVETGSPFDNQEELPSFGSLSPAVPETESVTAETGSDLFEQIEETEQVIEETELLMEDEEIEIELDIDSPFDNMDDQSAEPDNSDWLQSVGFQLDSVATAPRGVKFGSEMDSSDAQSHYDLGLAFKEMGLFDEALSEFRQAAQDPARKLACLIMQCVCIRERGEADKAVSMLTALLKPGLSTDDSCTVKYELAICHEFAGDNDKATVLLNEINDICPGFRDVNMRLNAANTSDSLDFSDDDFKNF